MSARGCAAQVDQPGLPPSVGCSGSALDGLYPNEADGWVDVEDDAVVADAPTIGGPREFEHVSGVGISFHRLERLPETVGVPRRKLSEAFCRRFGNVDASHTPWLLRAYSTCRADNPHRLARWHACRLASAARRPAGSRGVQFGEQISPSLRTRPSALFPKCRERGREQSSRRAPPHTLMRGSDPLIISQLPSRNPLCRNGFSRLGPCWGQKWTS